MWTALVLGLLAAVGVFVNGSGMSTINSADDPASSADAPASSDLASLGPVTLIADHYGGAALAECNTFYAHWATSPFGSDYDTVTGSTLGPGLSFVVPAKITPARELYLVVRPPNDDCTELASGDVVVSVEGTLLNGSTYEIAIIAA